MVDHRHLSDVKTGASAPPENRSARLGRMDWKAIKVVSCPDNAGHVVPCPICGLEGPKPEAFDVAHPNRSAHWLLVRECPDCRSFFYDPLETFPYDSEPFQAGHVFYNEIIAGISEMVDLLSRIPAPAGKRLLEIGCGSGYAMDIWQREMAGLAVGLEPSERARVGVDELGLDIRPQFLDSRAAIPGGAAGFDVVLAMEVIEHIENVRSFLQSMIGQLAPDGILVLTTPNADGLRNPDTVEVERQAILSPPYHTAVLSEAVLKQMLYEEGLPYAHFTSSDQQIKLYASRCFFDLPNPTPAQQRQVFRRYLESLMARCSLESPLYRGAAFRLLDSLVNAGELDNAGAIFEVLWRSLQAVFGPSIVDLEERIRFALEIRSPQDIGKSLPSFAPQVEFLAGMLAFAGRNDPSTALRHYRAAQVMAGKFACHPDFVNLTSTLYWRAGFEEAQALLRLGDEAGALDKWRFLARDEETDLMALERGMVPGGVPAEWREQSCMARLRHLVLKGEWERARDELRALHELLGCVGEPPASPAALVQEVNAEPVETSRIREPLWYLYCRASLALSAEDGQAEAREWFHCLARECVRLANHSGHRDVAAGFYFNACFHEALAAEFSGDLAGARELYRGLMEGTNIPEPHFAKDKDYWAQRARERMEALRSASGLSAMEER